MQHSNPIQQNIFKQIKPGSVTDLKECVSVHVTEVDGCFNLCIGVSIALGKRMGWVDGDSICVSESNGVFRFEKSGIQDCFTASQKEGTKMFTIQIRWNSPYGLPLKKRSQVAWQVATGSIFADLKRVKA